MKPLQSTYSTHFTHYVSIVKDEDFHTALNEQSSDMEQLLGSITEEQSTYKYAENKWTIKEVLLHISDAERVFDYRALAIARGEKSALPNFDENSYAIYSHADDRKWDDLVHEYFVTRKSTEALLNSFTETDLNATGTASGSPISVLALCFIIVGHAQHHVNIIRGKYLVF